MNQLQQKEELGNTFSKMQNEYYKTVLNKYNKLSTSMDQMLDESTTDINSLMMTLGVGLA